MVEQRFVVLDTETTGFKPEEGHRIVEIGAVELIGFTPGKEYQQYINPERDIPQASFEVHGLSKEFLSSYPTFAEIIEGFLQFIGDSHLLIHNSEFDMNFINHHLTELGYPALKNQVTDTVDVARKKFLGQSNSLDALCKRFNIDTTDRQLHGALKDSQLLVAVWIELHGGRQKKLEFNNTAETKSTNNNITEEAKTIREERHFAPKEEELQLHKKLLTDKIPNHRW